MTQQDSKTTNHDLKIGYAYEGDWIADMSDQDMKNARADIKAHIEQMETVIKMGITDASLDENLVLATDQQYVKQLVADAERAATGFLSDRLGKTVKACACGSSPRCVCDVETGIHSNVLMFDLEDANDDKITFHVTKGETKVPVNLIAMFTWDCKK